jgi:cytidylate kinase
MTTFAYKNLTISGLPGSGSTTLLRNLKDKLSSEGWRGFSGGEFMRTYAQEKGLFEEKGGLHHNANHYEDEFDRTVDFGMREKLGSEEKWILESWLSGFMAQGIPGVLKVLVVCSNEAIKIDRVVNRDGVSVAEAKHNMKQRYEENTQKWIRLYGQQWQEWVVSTNRVPAASPIDFWHPNLYDVVIDTFSHDKDETAQLVLDTLQGKKMPEKIT